MTCTCRLRFLHTPESQRDQGHRLLDGEQRYRRSVSAVYHDRDGVFQYLHVCRPVIIHGSS